MEAVDRARMIGRDVAELSTFSIAVVAGLGLAGAVGVAFRAVEAVNDWIAGRR